MKNPNPKLYLIFFLLLLIQINAFACDTLCVVYNGGNKKFEIDSSKNFFHYKCNQKEIGIYSDYLNKIIIPPIIAYNNYAGNTYFAIRGTEIKIIRGICDEFNYEIINCYTNNHFCFDSVMISLKIPCYINGRENNTFLSYKDLIHDYGIAETDKKMEVIVSDSSHFRNLYDFNKELNLLDLTKTKDSLFIRVNYCSYPENEIYEIRFNQLGWQARKISYQVSEFRPTLSFIFLNKCFVFCSKKKKNASWLYQCNISSIDSAYKTICKDSLQNILQQLNMLYLKKQTQIDTPCSDVVSDFTNPDGGTDCFDIEIATPYLYRYIYWDDHYFFNRPADAPIQKLYKCLFSGFDKEKYKKHKYKRNKWQ